MPLGDVVVDAELAQAIQAASDVVVDISAAHGREHSLEMQLPFVARLLPGIPIVPLVMGRQTRQAAFGRSSSSASYKASPMPCSRWNS